MASSIAATTIIRSIAFSRATASAICNSSSRFALTAMSLSSCWRLAVAGVGEARASPVMVFAAGLRLVLAERLAQQIVAQRELRFGDIAERQGDLGRRTSRRPRHR